MPQAATRTRKNTESSESSVWLAYDCTGFIVAGNPSKSPTGLHGSAKRPHGNASASPRKSDVGTVASGTILETISYYPFGGIRLDNATGTINIARKYLGQYFDSATSLNYLQARYQNPTQGQFISQDPIFLGNPSQQNISSPQSLNAYSYAEDNPIVGSDPTGRVAGWDDAAGFLVGGGIGALTYLGESAITGQQPTWAGGFGSFVGGGILGVGIVDAPETGGASEIVAGRIAAAVLNGEIAGAAGGLTSQAVENAGDLINKKPLPGLDLPGIAGDTLWGGGINGVAGGIVPMENFVSSPAISGGGGFNETELNYQQQQIHSTAPVTGGVAGGSVSAGSAFASAGASQVNSIYQTLTSILGDLTRILTSLQATYTVTPQKSSSSH
jgi:RHS repeat-associated protein